MMGKNKKIHVKDVKQIAYEIGLWAIDIERNKTLNKHLGKPSDVEFKDRFDNWIECRIEILNS